MRPSLVGCLGLSKWKDRLHSSPVEVNVSPPHPDPSISDIHTITSGVGPHHPGHSSTSSPECSDSCHPPVMEEIGGVPFIPGRLDHFKCSSFGCASGKRKTR